MADDIKRWLTPEIVAELMTMRPPSDTDAVTDRLYLPEKIFSQIPPSELRRLLKEVSQLRGNTNQQSAPDWLTLRMIASGRQALLEHIRKTGAFDLGEQYRALRLIDFGAESLIFLGESRIAKEKIAIKLPFVDYTDLAHLDVEQLLRRRQRLRHEAELLHKLRGSVLPAFVREYVGPNPMFPIGLPPFLRTEEQFLIMELIHGTRVDLVVRGFHKQERACCTPRLAVQFAIAFLSLAYDIERSMGPKAVYTDIKPENALVQGTIVRIVDAASIARTAVLGARFVTSELYLDPVDLARFRTGTLVPDIFFTLRSLARCMRLLVSNLPMFVGQPAPEWPPHLVQSLGSVIDALLARPSIAFAEAISDFMAVLGKLQCTHGSGAVSVPESLL